jgi:hypothetical protein
MKKPLDESTPEGKSRLLDQLEDAERTTNDPASKDQLEQVASDLRSAIVAGFIKRPWEADGSDNEDETKAAPSPKPK